MTALQHNARWCFIRPNFFRFGKPSLLIDQFELKRKALQILA
jgi:hypothetical protein